MALSSYGPPDHQGEHRSIARYPRFSYLVPFPVVAKDPDCCIPTGLSSKFLIGNVPVLTVIDGHGCLGIFDGVGLANAAEIVLPGL
jgi:hypothetical protein